MFNDFKLLKRNFDNLIYGAIIVAIIVNLIGSIINNDLEAAAVALIVGVIVLLPKLLPAKFNFLIPKRFILAIILFLFASLFLGEFENFYERFWWWDLLLHSFSAFGIGILGILIVLIIHYRDRIKASPAMLAMFAFLFAVSAGAIWEIIEYLIDLLFETNMQKSGLDDTMLDLIVDVVGALIASIYGYYFWKLNRKGDTIANKLRQIVSNNIKG